MSTPYSSTSLQLPSGFRKLLEGLALEVLRAQPTDLVAFAAHHFQTLLEQRESSRAAWEAQLDEQRLTQPPCQELEEGEEKEDKDEEERAGGGTSTVTKSSPRGGGGGGGRVTLSPKGRLPGDTTPNPPFGNI